MPGEMQHMQLRVRLLRRLIKERSAEPRNLRALEFLLMALFTRPSSGPGARRLLPEEDIDVLLARCSLHDSPDPGPALVRYLELTEAALATRQMSELAELRTLEQARALKYELGARYYDREVVKASVQCLLVMERLAAEPGYATPASLVEQGWRRDRLPFEPRPAARPRPTRAQEKAQPSPPPLQEVPFSGPFDLVEGTLLEPFSGGPPLSPPPGEPHQAPPQALLMTSTDPTAAAPRRTASPRATGPRTAPVARPHSSTSSSQSAPRARPSAPARNNPALLPRLMPRDFLPLRPFGWTGQGATDAARARLPELQPVRPMAAQESPLALFPFGLAEEPETAFTTPFDEPDDLDWSLNGARASRTDPPLEPAGPEFPFETSFLDLGMPSTRPGASPTSARGRELSQPQQSSHLQVSSQPQQSSHLQEPLQPQVEAQTLPQVEAQTQDSFQALPQREALPLAQAQDSFQALPQREALPQGEALPLAQAHEPSYVPSPSSPAAAPPGPAPASRPAPPQGLRRTGEQTSAQPPPTSPVREMPRISGSSVLPRRAKAVGSSQASDSALPASPISEPPSARPERRLSGSAGVRTTGERRVRRSGSGDSPGERPLFETRSLEPGRERRGASGERGDAARTPPRAEAGKPGTPSVEAGKPGAPRAEAGKPGTTPPARSLRALLRKRLWAGITLLNLAILALCTGDWMLEPTPPRFEQASRYQAYRLDGPITRTPVMSARRFDDALILVAGAPWLDLSMDARKDLTRNLSDHLVGSNDIHRLLIVDQTGRHLAYATGDRLEVSPGGR